MSHLVFRTHGTAESATQLNVATRDFTMIVDEPPALGGVDAGPNPVEYVLAALSGCLNVVIHLVAKERGIRIDGMRIHAHGVLDPTRLFGHETDQRAGYQRIDVEVEVDTDASEAEVADLLRAAEERCPVSDNLAHPTPIAISRRAA